MASSCRRSPQGGKRCPIAFALDLIVIWSLPECRRLFAVNHHDNCLEVILVRGNNSSSRSSGITSPTRASSDIRAPFFAEPEIRMIQLCVIPI
jgi:hypothetical protein